jgi:PAS domain S-box-containing protein
VVGSTGVPWFRLIATLSLVASMALPARADDAAEDALRGQTKFKAFGSEEGLNNLVIGGIAQDPSGLLWVATDDGVYRFDGERFAHFSAAQGLISTLNFAVAIAADGAPCVGSPNGVVCWNGTRFSQAGGLPKASVHSMVTFAGKLWVGTDRGGLYVQDGAGGFMRAPGWPGGPTAKIRGLWADASGLVVGDGEVVELTAGDGTWQVLDVGIRGEQIEAVLRDRDGTLWVRTPLHMWRWPRGAAGAVDATDGLPTGYDMVDAATPMAIGPRGEVMVGTDGGLADREGDRWRLIDRSAGLPAGATRTLFVDREGTLWVGAAALLQRRGRDLIEHWDVASGLPGETAWNFRRDPRGTLWVGTNRCLARAIGGRWECLPGSEGRTVRSMVFPPQGGVFIGGAPSDLLYIDAAGAATSLGHGDRPANSHILALALGPEGDLWIGTRAGLFRLRGAVLPGPLERVLVPGVRPDFRAVSLAVVGGQLWVGSEEGVVVLDRGAWHLLDRRSGLRDTATSYLAPRADGRMCVAYRESIGVSCFRYDNGAATAFEHIGPEEGLASGMVYLFGEDREQRLWIGSGNGVDVVTPSGIDHFDNSDGIAGNDSSANAFLLDGDGSLWLGSSGGVTHLLAQRYRGPPPPPHTVFLDAQLGGQPVGNLHGALEVPHDRNALALELASSSLIAPRRVSYQIRLSPLEQEWSVTPRQVRFAGLAHDIYRLEVRSRIGAGSWGPTAELGFAVLPAWWHTRWFMVLIAFVGLGVIAGGFTWRQRTVLRRRTRQLHDQADATFRAVVDLMPDLIAVHRDRELIYLNRANRRFLGIEDTGVQRRSQPLIDRVHPDDRAQVAELFRRVGQADPEAASDVVEMRMTGPDGSWRACEISAVRVELGGVPVVVTSSRDVTERKRMRAKLIVSDRMASLGTLAAGIAHEINNPLAYVAGNLEAVAETFQSTHHQPSHADCVEMSAAINDARDGAERVRRIVGGLRSFSRSEEEKRTPLALVDVLDAAIRLTGNELRHRARLVRELGPVPLVVADDGRLTQVFINLLINAAHAIPEGHSDDNCITVRTRTDDAGRAVVEVADTGKGMAPEVQARVFDPFFTTKDVGEGTGLGLSICHGIVSGLGGQISIDSAPGRGTLVRVVLPAKPRDVAPAPAPVAVSEPVAAGNDQRRHRVMLIDDELQVVQTTERLLRKDYDVTVAVCGKDALALIAQGARFDAIISDVMMPNMTGIDLFEELRRMAPDQAQRVLFLSGGAFTAQTRERLDQLGVPQLEKPVTAKQLRDCVLRIVSDASRCEP